MIELKPWQSEDFPIAWRWIDESWQLLSDDYADRSLESFIDNKQWQGAVNVGVWVDGDLCGLLILVPISPILAQGHCVFRRRTVRPDVTVEVMRMAMRLAWHWGYRKLWCWVYPKNRAAIRLLKVLGAHFEGELLSHTVKDGKLASMLSYALLRNEQED